MRASSQSRVANLLFMRSLAARAHGVTVNAIDPGNTRTAIGRELPAPARVLTSPFLKSAEKGARTSLYLATSPDVADVTGTYFRGTRVIKQNPITLDDDNARRLWEISEQLTAASATAHQPVGVVKSCGPTVVRRIPATVATGFCVETVLETGEMSAHESRWAHDRLLSGRVYSGAEALPRTALRADELRAAVARD